MLGLLWHLHPLAVVVLIAATAPEVVVLGYYAQRHYRLLTRRASARRMAQYLSDLLASRDSVKELRLFSLHGLLLKRFRHFIRLFIEDARQQRFSLGRAELLLGLLSMIGTALIWIYAVVQAVLKRITVGDVALAFQAAEQGRSALRGVFRSGALFYEDTLYACNLFTFLDLQRDGMEGALAPARESGKGLLNVSQPIREGIEFCHVSFAYPRSKQYVLSDLSFLLRPGETVAVVGANGAGKTTLVKLLARLYDPTEGAILVDDKDLREYDPEEWWKHLGVIFQDFVKYDLSVQENVGFGQVEYVEDRERVVLVLLCQLEISAL